MKRVLLWIVAAIALLVAAYTALDHTTRVYLVREGVVQPQLARTPDRAVLVVTKMRMGQQTNALLRRLHLGIWSLILAHPDTEYSGAMLILIGPKEFSTYSLPHGMWRAVAHNEHLILESFDFSRGATRASARNCLELISTGTVPCDHELEKATSLEKHAETRSEVDLDSDPARPHWQVEYLDAKTSSTEARFNLNVAGTPIVIRRQIHSSLRDDSGEFDDDSAPYFFSEEIHISGAAGQTSADFVASDWRTVDAQEYAALFPSIPAPRSSWKLWLLENIALVTFALVFGLSYLAPWIIKLWIVRRVSGRSTPTGYDFLPAIPSQFPLDLRELEGLTQDLDREGFALLGEFSIVPTNVPTTHRVYLRLWSNERLNMFAVVRHISGSNVPASQNFGIVSVLEDDWWVETYNRRLGKDRPLLLHDKTLGFRYDEATVQELIHRNQERRAVVMEGLSRAALKGYSLADFQEIYARRATHIHQQAKIAKTFFYWKWLVTRRMPSNQTEHWGAFEREKKKVRTATA